MPKPLLFVRVLLIVLGINLSGQAQTPANSNQTVLFKEQTAARLFASGPLSVSIPKAAFAGKQRIPVFLKFKQLPTPAIKKHLLNLGVELHEFIPGATYLATVSRSLTENDLSTLGVEGSFFPNEKIKQSFDPVLSPNTSSASLQSKKNYHVWFAPGNDSATIIGHLKLLFGHEMPAPTETRMLYSRMMELPLSEASLQKLLQQSYVLHILQAPDLFALNLVGTETHLAGLVHRGNSSIPGLTGKGITVGLGDAGRVYHIDLGYQNEQGLMGNFHSTHVAGTLAGKGLVNPIMRGFAYDLRMEVEYFNNIIFRTPSLYAEQRMVITNNSYGAGSTCLPYAGQYSGYCGQADQQLLDMPHLIHVFAAGNTGSLKCGNYPTSYRTIDNAFQAAKNVLTVGGTNERGTESVYSKGPTMDGRIKPEIVAISTNVLSTGTNNNYTRLDGTSMASPQVTGTVALLYERYRQLFNNADPGGDLIKALICNTATDIGTPYVDFANGFGWLNTKKAVETLNNRNWFSGSVEHQEEQSFEITLPEAVKNLKIMLYWHDKPASYYSAKALVNDLDITVHLPDGSIYDPYILDTSVAGVLNQAVRGKDRVNNIEQVVIDHAVAGRYLIKVKGHEVPFGPQSYKIVYNWDDGLFELLHPVGSERFKHGQTRIIQWRYAGHEKDDYEFSYSTNNGSTWTIITTGFQGEGRKNWTLPGFTNNNVQVKVKHLPSGQERISERFSVLPEMNYTLTNPCKTTISINWKIPPNPDSVGVLLYNGSEFETLAYSKDTVYLLRDVEPGQRYWITLQPFHGGIAGERSIAKSIIANNTVDCISDAEDNDFSIHVTDSLLVSRSPSLRDSLSPFVIKLKNEGNTEVKDTVFLHLVKGNSTVASDTIIENWLPQQQKTISSLKPIGEPGETSDFKVVVMTSGDPNPANDTAAINWRYLFAAPITLPFEEKFEGLEDHIYMHTGFNGVAGSPAWDISLPSAQLSFETRASQGFFMTTKIEDQKLQLVGNYNFSNYSIGDDVKLSLDIPDLQSINLECFIRGNDTSSWVNVQLVDPLTQSPQIGHLNISRILAKAGQKFSASFQIRFQVVHTSYQKTLHILKSLRFFTMEGDLRLSNIAYSKYYVTDGDSVRFRLWVVNQGQKASSSVEVGIETPNGLKKLVELESIAADDTVVVRFTIPVEDWPKTDATIRGWVYGVEDQNRADDTVRVNLSYARKVDGFPYLESFESGKAGWGSSFLYEHSTVLGPSIAPFKPANGKSFWGTQWVSSIQGIGFIVSSGYLVSPLFDLAKVINPYFSVSANKQLCDGKDSVYVEYSIDTGRVWTRLLTQETAVNWYSPADGNAWIGCDRPGFDRWRVVSAPLPSGVKTIQIRFSTSARNLYSTVFPKLPGGLLIDDFHLFDYKYPLFNGSLSSRHSVTVTNSFQPALSGEEIYAEIFSSESEDEKRTIELAPAIGGTSFVGNLVLPLNWVVQPTGKTAAQKGRLRLYLSDQKVQDWLDANPCDTCKQKFSAYDLSVFRYNGPSATINHNLEDNQPGFETVWDPQGFSLVPYEKGYYAEIETELSGEFYLGRNTNLAELQFSTDRLSNSNEVLTSWQIESWSGIARLELERSTNAESGFQQIYMLPINLTTEVKGNYKDGSLATPQTYYYRVKLHYNNGQVRYSSIRMVSFTNVFEAQVFPNPGKGSQTTLKINTPDAGEIRLELLDLSGKRLAANTKNIGSGEQAIDISGLTRNLAAGFYIIQIHTGKEKKTLRLVISGN